MAGNYVVLHPAGEQVNVGGVGFSRDLSTLRRHAYAAKAGALIYTRLNVSGATREAEHEDICASHPKAKVQLTALDCDHKVAPL